MDVFLSFIRVRTSGVAECKRGTLVIRLTSVILKDSLIVIHRGKINSLMNKSHLFSLSYRFAFVTHLSFGLLLGGALTSLRTGANGTTIAITLTSAERKLCKVRLGCCKDCMGNARQDCSLDITELGLLLHLSLDASVRVSVRRISFKTSRK